MTPARQASYWAIALVVFLALLFLLRDVMLPFVAGLAAAYFLDPVVDKLEELALEYAEIPMLSRTHGQTASP